MAHSTISSVKASPGVTMMPQGSARPAGTDLQMGTRQAGGRAFSEANAVDVPSVPALSQAVDGLNEALKVVQTHLRFRLHEGTHRYYVEIVDTLEDEVVREVPPKRFLDMIADMYEFMGLIIDEKR